MATIESRGRGALRALRGQPPLIQALAATTAVVMLASLITAGTRLSSDETPIALAPATEGGASFAEGGAGAAADVPGGIGTAPAGTPGATGEAPGVAVTGGGGGSSGTSGGGGTGATGGSGSSGSAPPQVKLTASDRGVTASAIKVVFAWYSAASSDEITGTTANIENQEDAINAFVGDINARGGILGRKIDPVVDRYDPIAGPYMQAKCELWANDQQVFAVVDGVGAWHGANQTCLANNKTPLVSGWTTVKSHAEASAPYIWWTAASAEDIIDHLVLWGNRRGLITKANMAKVGMVFSDRPGDKQALDRMQKALGRLGLKLHLEVIPFDNASAQQEMPGAVQRMKQKGVNRIVMMLPFTTFSFWLNETDSQEYFPHLLLSDYESTMVVAEALLGPQHPRALHGAKGPVSLNLGVKDDPSAYTAEETRCNNIWRKAYKDEEDYADLQRGGVGFRWCQGVSVFAAAARSATLASGGAITRVNFASLGMEKLKGIPSAMTPTLTWGPKDYAGTEWMKVVEVRVNTEQQPRRCPRELDIDGNGACQAEVEPFGRILRFS